MIRGALVYSCMSLSISLSFEVHVEFCIDVSMVFINKVNRGMTVALFEACTIKYHGVGFQYEIYPISATSLFDIIFSRQYNELKMVYYRV